eukprot:scaffold56167_cov63-Phaeocystis_antarctica.AAC.1
MPRASRELSACRTPSLLLPRHARWQSLGCTLSLHCRLVGSVQGDQDGLAREAQPARLLAEALLPPGREGAQLLPRERGEALPAPRLPGRPRHPRQARRLRGRLLRHGA